MNSEAGRDLPEGLVQDRLPRHVAIIMDGNGRWAKARKWDRIKGHDQGSQVVREIVRASRSLGIPYLTLFAFSTENWQRPALEVKALMALLAKFLKSERREILENRIRLGAIGQIEKLPPDVGSLLKELMDASCHHTGMQLTLALSYGAREELVRMVRNVCHEALARTRDQKTAPDDILSAIDEALIDRHLYTAGMPDPDLLIRTSGEMRISNFLLWQIAYAELHVTKTLWPDFSRAEYIEILKEYQQRDRRFGRI